MCALANSTRIRIKDKALIKNRIQNPVNCMMDNSVAHNGFMDSPHLWILNAKSDIIEMAIGVVF